MQGTRFLIVDENGQATNHGIILQQITPERYLCRFVKRPAVQRIIRLDEIETWNLFQNDEELNAFITQLTVELNAARAAQIPPPAEPPSTPAKKKKKSKKKAGKSGLEGAENGS